MRPQRTWDGSSKPKAVTRLADGYDKESEDEGGSAVLKDRTGNVAALVADLEEFTERKRVEQTLKTSEEWFRALIENA